MPIDLFVFVLGTFVGALVAGVSGFAFGLIASAIWLHAITPAHSVTLVAAFAILIQGASLWKFRSAIQISRLVPFFVGGAVGVPLGAEVLRWVAPWQMRSAIGLTLVLFSVYGLARPRLPPVRSGTVADGVVGFAGGFLGASTGLAGIPIIVWSTVCGWTKDEQRAVFQPVVVGIFLMVLAWSGATELPVGTPRLFLIGLPAVIFGSWLGLQLYGRIDENSFRRLVLVLLTISGLTLLPWQFLANGWTGGR